MDGDQMPTGSAHALAPDRAMRERADSGGAAPRPKTLRWFVIVGIAAGDRAGRALRLQPLPRPRDRELLRSQQAAAGADQRGHGRGPIDRAALCARHRLDLGRPSGHGQPGGRRAGHPDLLPAGAEGEGRRPAGPAQRCAGPGRPRQLSGAGETRRKSRWARSKQLVKRAVHSAGDGRSEPEPARPGQCRDREDPGDHRAEADPRAVFADSSACARSISGNISAPARRSSP